MFIYNIWTAWPTDSLEARQPHALYPCPLLVAFHHVLLVSWLTTFSACLTDTEVTAVAAAAAATVRFGFLLLDLLLKKGGDAPEFGF